MLLNNKAFSLIELVVVMAIVGILMMIGVPQVQSYVAKAKRTEARSNLAQIYTAEKAFHAEYSTYLGDLNHIGFQPEGILNYYYGFSGAGGADVPAQMGGGDPVTLDTRDICGLEVNRIDEPQTLCFHSTNAEKAFTGGATPVVGGDFEAESTWFAAFASGQISDASARVDQWGIDHRKILMHFQDGISGNLGPVDRLPDYN